MHEGFDDRIGAHLHVAVDYAGVRIKDGHTRIQQLAALGQPQPRIEHHHLRTRVAAEHFARVFSLNRYNPPTRPVKHSRHIGEVVLAMWICSRKLRNVLVQSGCIKSIEARVDLADFLLPRVRRLLFDNRLHLGPSAFADHTPVSEGIVEVGAEQSHGRLLGGVEVAELANRFRGNQGSVARQDDHLAITQ